MEPTRRGRVAVTALGVLLVGVVGALDLATGLEISLALLYLLPVALVGWRAGEWPAIAVAALSAAAWLAADVLAGRTFSHVAVPIWNAVIRLGIFLATAVLTARLRAARDELARRALRDPLTGVLNSETFSAELDGRLSSWRDGGPAVAVAYLDLDDFKSVNDRLGHAGGDRVLRRVTGACSAVLAEGDVMGRLGGDEFAVLLADEQPLTRVEKIADAVASALEGEGSRAVTASIGLLRFESPPAGAREALHAADLLMYDAKRRGKARILVETERGPGLGGPETPRGGGRQRRPQAD